jgi:amidase
MEPQYSAIPLPGNQTVAPPHDTYGVPEYTVLANLLNVSFPSPIMEVSTHFVVPSGCDTVPPCE